MTKKGYLVLILVVMLLVGSLLVGSLLGCKAEAPTAHPIVNVPLWTCPTGTATYLIAYAGEDLSRKYHPWLRIKAVTTTGYAYNLLEHSRTPAIWQETVIGTTPAVLSKAAAAIPPFEQKVTGYKYLFNVNIPCCWLVSLNPDIRTIADLKGKTIGLGRPGAQMWAKTLATLLEHGYGITEDNTKILYLGQNKAAEELINGHLDAAPTSAYINPVTGDLIPGPIEVILEASGKKLFHLSFANGDAAILKEQGVGGLKDVKIPAGVAKDLDQDILQPAGPNLFGVKDSFPDEVGREFVKVYLDYNKELVDYTTFGKLMAPEGMAWGLTKENALYGAVETFEEYGFTIPEK